MIPTTRDYESAVSHLNSLQSNASILDALKKSGKLNDYSLPEMREFVKRMGYKLEDLNDLSVIHITGTKGKGSTSSFCESILRGYGHSTGLYTSPHLQEVRERIKINGKPISKELFAKYYFEILEKFEAAKDEPASMDLLYYLPTYFRFLTLLALHAFKQEKVDVSILEVGIGGTFDPTNVVPKPVACGIVSIGFDHEALLGNTIKSIAHHKGGIFKESVPAYTVNQIPEAMEVLIEQSNTLKAPLFLALSLSQYTPSQEIKLGIPGEHQFSNASLAMALSKTWLEQKKRPDSIKSLNLKPGFHLNENPPFELSITQQEIKALKETFWPGRCQTIQLEEGLTLYLDGAHTSESLNACIAWFKNVVPKDGKRVLVFNCSFDRNPEKLLGPLRDFSFDFACFCPNQAYIVKAPHSDTANFMVPPNTDLENQKSIQRIWNQNDDNLSTNSKIFPAMKETLDFLKTFKAESGQGQPISVLITGSLHLVGAALINLNHPVD